MSGYTMREFAEAARIASAIETKPAAGFTYQAADIIITSNDTLIARVIKWMLRSRADRISQQAHHVGIIVRQGGFMDAKLVESWARVLWLPFRKSYRRSNGTYLLRPLNIKTADQLKIAARAEDYAGDTYGWQTLWAYAVDKLLEKILGRDVYWARRRYDDKPYLVCSALVASAVAFRDSGYTFGVKGRNHLAPDDILSFAVTRPDIYRVYRLI